MGTTRFEENRKRNASGESATSTDSLSKYIPTPPDGGWGWVIVFASFINHVIVDGVAFTFGIFYMEFLRFFKAGKSQTALVGSLLAGFYLMAGKLDEIILGGKESKTLQNHARAIPGPRSSFERPLYITHLDFKSTFLGFQFQYVMWIEICYRLCNPL